MQKERRESPACSQTYSETVLISNAGRDTSVNVPTDKALEESTVIRKLLRQPFPDS